MAPVPYAVLANGPLPIRRAWVPLSGVHHQRVTALYGKNGAGKTHLLRAVSAALDGRRPDGVSPGGRVDVVGAAYAPVVLFVRGFRGPGFADDSWGAKDFDQDVALSIRDLDSPTRELAEHAHALGQCALVPTEAKVEVWLAVDRTADLADRSTPHWPAPEALRSMPRAACDLSGLLPAIPAGLLAPPPDLYGLPLDPSWAPAPLIKIGTSMPFSVFGGPMPAHLSVDEITDEEIERSTASLVTTWHEQALQGDSRPRKNAPDPGNLADWASVEGKFWLEDTARWVLRSSCPSAEFTLHVGFGLSRELGARWWADVGAGSPIPFASLSSAEARWARTALAESLMILGKTPYEELGGLEVDTRAPAILTVDEPERGLHRQAVRRMRDQMRVGRSDVVVATHSFEFLEERDQVAQVAVRRGNAGVRAHLTAIRPEDSAEALALGISVGDLRTLYRTVLFVEGPHDELILQHWMGSLLTDAGVLLTPVYLPSREGEAYAASRSDGQIRLAVELVPGPVCYLLDKDRLGLQGLREAALTRSADDACQLLDRRRVAAERSNDRLAASFCNVLAWAVKREMLDRVVIVQHSEPDIAQFLPCASFRNGEFDTWRSAWAAFTATNSPHTGRNFKRFMSVNLKTIRAALSESPLPPAGFLVTIDRLDALLCFRTPRSS